jgi:hypothetical protein
MAVATAGSAEPIALRRNLSILCIDAWGVRAASLVMRTSPRTRR